MQIILLVCYIKKQFAYGGITRFNRANSKMYRGDVLRKMTSCSVKVAPTRKPRPAAGFRLCFYREIFHHVPAEWISRFSYLTTDIAGLIVVVDSKVSLPYDRLAGSCLSSTGPYLSRETSERVRNFFFPTGIRNSYYVYLRRISFCDIFRLLSTRPSGRTTDGHWNVIRSHKALFIIKRLKKRFDLNSKVHKILVFTLKMSTKGHSVEISWEINTNIFLTIEYESFTLKDPSFPEWSYDLFICKIFHSESFN